LAPRSRNALRMESIRSAWHTKFSLRPAGRRVGGGQS
jgi:hypothetical protein